MQETIRDPQLLKGVLRMLVLKVLSDEETYGYELVTRLTRRGLAGISTGTVYPVLNRLEREGLLGSRLVASTAGPARKYYGVTASGGAALAEAISGWDDLAAAVSSVLGSSPPSGALEPSAHSTTKGKTS
ncbi:PadR family transcriptional regulator [Tessaracoccus antarcticus]|uniref:PadR family transcriptional regulator n=1 Tax=Tessaracoccus antarcticus TaxID=2479848 RepID=A0A3M0GA86_9ACTN|nr:PadR family transcriptional regulator [Tessaracoccus antarcticus]RMB61187.1 PadR family transcriptional regulator [Tessaracoccus antarcticus]